MTLLIVDDNVQIREIIKTMFADISDQIFESTNGLEAIDSFNEHHQDWVLMDLEMPVCDGIMATRRIRQKSPNARIVIITAHNSNVLKKAAHDAGACAYILKDNLMELRAKLSAKGITATGLI